MVESFKYHFKMDHRRLIRGALIIPQILRKSQNAATILVNSLTNHATSSLIVNKENVPGTYSKALKDRWAVISVSDFLLSPFTAWVAVISSPIDAVAVSHADQPFKNQISFQHILLSSSSSNKPVF